MVECESVYVSESAPSVLVLIDTWWNVNYTTYKRSCYSLLVLIETWWNVNSIFVDTVDWGWLF